MNLMVISQFQKKKSIVIGSRMKKVEIERYLPNYVFQTKLGFLKNANVHVLVQISNHQRMTENL